MLPESYSRVVRWTRHKYSPNHIYFISLWSFALVSSLIFLLPHFFLSFFFVAAATSSSLFPSFFRWRYLIAFCVHRCVNACTRSNSACVLFNMCTSYKRRDLLSQTLHTNLYILIFFFFLSFWSRPKWGFYPRRLLATAAAAMAVTFTLMMT